MALCVAGFACLLAFFVFLVGFVLVVGCSEELLAHFLSFFLCVSVSGLPPFVVHAADMYYRY